MYRKGIFLKQRSVCSRCVRLRFVFRYHEGSSLHITLICIVWGRCNWISKYPTCTKTLGFPHRTESERAPPPRAGQRCHQLVTTTYLSAMWTNSGVSQKIIIFFIPCTDLMFSYKGRAPFRRKQTRLDTEDSCLNNSGKKKISMLKLFAWEPILYWVVNLFQRLYL